MAQSNGRIITGRVSTVDFQDAPHYELEPLNNNLQPLVKKTKLSSITDRIFGHFLLSHYPSVDGNGTRRQRIVRAFLCPPHGPVGFVITGILLIAVAWLTVLTVLGSNASAGSEAFAVLTLLTSALAGGFFFRFIRFPPLLGMLLVGLAWRNLNISSVVDMETQISSRTSFYFRNMAVAIIVLRGGLGLNPDVLRARWPVILRLSLIPCSLEACTWSLTAYLLLSLPWVQALLLGSVISAASSAVVIPAMLQFQEDGLGVDKGIPTIAMAATSLDNILALSLFGIVHGIVFSEGSIVQSLAHIPAQIAAGIVFGIVWGILLRYFPSSDMRKGHVLTARIALLLGGGMLSIFGAQFINYRGAGPLACLILAFVGAVSWRQQNGWGKSHPSPASEILNGLWFLLEPMLFGLIGAQINLRDIDSHVIGYGILCMVVALTVRMGVSFLAVKGADLNWKECLFIAIAWLPKATVQAVVGPVALETALRTQAGPELEEFGQHVVSIAAISILITAAIGALAVKFSGPILLQQTKRNTNVNDDAGSP